MGTEFGTFVGIEQIPLAVTCTDLRKIKRFYVSVPKTILVTLRG